MKNRCITAVLLLLFAAGCVSPYRVVTYTISTRPVYTISPAPQKIIILNSYDIESKKFRDNKKALFVTLTDELLDSAAQRIANKTGIITEPVRGFTNTAGNTDSLVHVIMAEKNATHAIVITDFDAYFSQTHVEVTKDPTTKSKNRMAYYDIVSDIHFSFYNTDSLIKTMEMLISQFHSSRNVASGLLAAGPNIVVQEKYAHNISLANLQQYLNYYFPGQKFKTRTLLADKGFENMLAAVDKKDYETALLEAKLLTTNAAGIKTAMACYDCAVFCEMKGLPAESLDYLRMALRNYNLPQAYEMLKELEP